VQRVRAEDALADDDQDMTEVQRSRNAFVIGSPVAAWSTDWSFLKPVSAPRPPRPEPLLCSRRSAGNDAKVHEGGLKTAS